MVREVVVRKEDLREPRLLLCKEEFGFFVSEYNLYPSYMCSDEIVDGQSGTRLRHTSNSNDGWFIPDAGVNGVGEVCPCDTEKRESCCCRHFCAKRKHRKEPVFCRENIHPRHIFTVELPLEKASVQVDDTDETFIIQDVSANYAGALPVAAPTTASVAQHDLVFMSPSKLSSSTTPAPPPIPTDTFLRKKPSNVGYNRINDAGCRLAKAASGHSNRVQHVALSLLANVTDMLENMDFNSNKYDDTPYSLIAKQISSLSKPDDAATLQPGMPKAKRHDAYGVCTYRKGADKCTTTGGRKPNGCGFCQGDRRDYVSRTP